MPPERLLRGRAAGWPGGQLRTASLCVFITAVPIAKLFAGVEGDSGGHVLQETTSRGLCGLVCPSCTSERGGKGDGGRRHRPRVMDIS